MADLGDVANALVTLCQTALYPSGVDAGSPVGINFRIYRGAPTADVLDADLRAGYTQVGGNGKFVLSDAGARISHLTVNGRPGMGRILKPYVFSEPAVPFPVAITLTATAAGNTVTLGGTIAAGQGASIWCNGTAYGATAGASDTLSTLATTLAAQINANTPATATGAVITIPAATTLYANGSAVQTVYREVQRQIQGFEIDIFTSSRDLRDAISTAIMSSLGATYNITMPDGFQALLRLAPPVQVDDDRPEKELLFVRKTYWQVEYATTATTQVVTQAIIADILTTPAGDPLATIIEA